MKSNRPKSPLTQALKSIKPDSSLFLEEDTRIIPRSYMTPTGSPVPEYSSSRTYRVKDSSGRRNSLMSSVDKAINDDSSSTETKLTGPKIGPYGSVLVPTTLPSYIDCSGKGLYVTNIPSWFERHLPRFRAVGAQRVKGFPNTLFLKFRDEKDTLSAAHSLHNRSLPERRLNLDVIQEEQVTFLYENSMDAMTTIVVIENLPSNTTWKTIKDMTTRAKCSAVVNFPRFVTEPQYLPGLSPSEQPSLPLKYVEIRFSTVIMAKRFVERYNGEKLDPEQDDCPPMDVFFRFLRDAERSREVFSQTGLTKQQLLEDYKKDRDEDEVLQNQLMFEEITRLLS